MKLFVLFVLHKKFFNDVAVEIAVVDCKDPVDLSRAQDSLVWLADLLLWF